MKPDRIRTLRHLILPDEHVREAGGMLAVWSEQKRTGDWAMPRNMRVLSVMASAVIDLREARIPEGHSTIEVFTLFGAVEIIVPPGVRVDCEGSSLGGEFTFLSDPTEPADFDAPTIHIRGGAYFASVSGAVRYAGESQRAARQRIKAITRGET